MVEQSFFGEDYFQRGIETGKSCYQNYRWIPELTIPMAMTFVDFLDIGRKDQVLDFGCSRGYLVKALRWLNRQAWGEDISEYAIANADDEVKQFVSLSKNATERDYSLTIAKDVFEHIEPDNLSVILHRFNSKHLFAVVPLGDNGKYRAEANNCDKSHVVCEDEGWWTEFLFQNGWILKDFRFRLDGCKDSYYVENPKAHGFFLLRRK